MITKSIDLFCYLCVPSSVGHRMQYLVHHKSENLVIFSSNSDFFKIIWFSPDLMFSQSSNHPCLLVVDVLLTVLPSKIQVGIATIWSKQSWVTYADTSCLACHMFRPSSSLYIVTVVMMFTILYFPPSVQLGQPQMCHSLVIRVHTPGIHCGHHESLLSWATVPTCIGLHLLHITTLYHLYHCTNLNR